MYGSENNDLYTVKEEKFTKTNNSGGIWEEFKQAYYYENCIQASIINFTKTKYGRHQPKTTLQVKGRHDPCVVPRAPPVVDSLVH